jgi:predicted glycoside hydrolase/deacetylase ChbG (UPF0249 family)
MKSPRRRLIVNADDLGRTSGINEGIFRSHEDGIVTSATLMVNYPAAVEAAERLPQYPKLGIGLHVALSGGPSALPPDQIPSLVDENGRFPPKPDGLANANSAEILLEVRAQLARFRRLTGRLPTHLDSHHHSHRHPAVARGLIVIAREEDLPVRATSPAIAELLTRESIASTDFFVERFYGSEVTRQSILEILEGIPAGITEVMCHPAVIDEELQAGSSYVAEREEELALLTDPEIRACVDHQGLELIHFGDL